jgi:hypothetical protein
MSVYVDNPRHSLRRMKMCHMIADSHEELGDMARKIGVAVRHIQDVGTAKEHFDVCLSRRRLAIELGAIPVTTRDHVRKIVEKEAARDVTVRGPSSDANTGDSACTRSTATTLKSAPLSNSSSSSC